MDLRVVKCSFLFSTYLINFNEKITFTQTSRHNISYLIKYCFNLANVKIRWFEAFLKYFVYRKDLVRSSPFKAMYQQESITCCICSVKTPDELHLERHIWEDHADIFQTEQDDASPVNATCENGFDVKCDVGFNVFAYDVTHDASNNVSHDVTNYVTQHNDVTTDTCKIDFRNGFELARHQKTVEHLSKMAEAAQRLIVAINQAPAGAKSLPTKCDKPKQKEFVCKICNKVLKTKWSYDQHQQQIHRGQKRTYNCRFCQMNFPNGYALYRHQLTEGHVSKRPIVDSSEFKNGFRCNICDARFKNKKTLTAHQKNIHVQDQTECELCKKVFANRDYYSSHKRLVHEGRIKKKYVKLKTNCEICNIVVNECNYDKHRKKHLESKIRAANIEFVPCDVCGKVVRKSNYDRHIRHIHKTVKMVRSRKLVECKICHITVLVKSLRRHEMEVHDGIKRTFTCAQCRIDFETDNLLQKHMRAHKNKENLIMSENW